MLMPAAVLVMMLLGAIALDAAAIRMQSRELRNVARSAANDALSAAVDVGHLRETGEIRISGRTLSSGEFVSLVNRELRRVGDDPNLLGIVIRADQRGASAGVNTIVEALNKLQIKRVRIAVEVPQ